MRPAPRFARTVSDLRTAVADWRAQGLSVGFAPTMGALHDGHASLVRAAKARHDRAVASLFVNPAQFSPSEDFERYPRDESGDAAVLEAAGCDLIFAPAVAEMYPEGFSTAVAVSGVSAPLEGEARPHFFGGVATIVAKLLIQCGADTAFFGEKDYQQLLVVKRLARDLDLPTAIVGCPTVREADGLAMSSRNAYLSPPDRVVAAQLNLVLKQTIAKVRAGASIASAEAEAQSALAEHGFDAVDYVAVRDAETLAPLSRLERPARILAAARIGATRLIDNMAV